MILFQHVLLKILIEQHSMERRSRLEKEDMFCYENYFEYLFIFNKLFIFSTICWIIHFSILPTVSSPRNVPTVCILYGLP